MLPVTALTNQFSTSALYSSLHWVSEQAGPWTCASYGRTSSSVICPLLGKAHIKPQRNSHYLRWLLGGSFGAEGSEPGVVTAAGWMGEEVSSDSWAPWPGRTKVYTEGVGEEVPSLLKTLGRVSRGESLGTVLVCVTQKVTRPGRRCCYGPWRVTHVNRIGVQGRT